MFNLHLSVIQHFNRGVGLELPNYSVSTIMSLHAKLRHLYLPDTFLCLCIMYHVNFVCGGLPVCKYKCVALTPLFFLLFTLNPDKD